MAKEDIKQPASGHAQLGQRFNEARTALFNWTNYDKGEEFYVNDMTMIDRRSDKAIATVIEYTGSDKPQGNVGYVVVTKKFATTFSGVHMIVSRIPTDNDWDAVHTENVKDFSETLESLYGRAEEIEERAQEMLAVRRQMLIYQMIFPECKMAVVATEAEKLLVADAKITGNGGQYCEALGEFVQKYSK